MADLWRVNNESGVFLSTRRRAFNSIQFEIWAITFVNLRGPIMLFIHCGRKMFHRMRSPARNIKYGNSSRLLSRRLLKS